MYLCGYGAEECSWGPAVDVLDAAYFEDFHHRHLFHPAPRPRAVLGGCPQTCLVEGDVIVPGGSS